MIEKGLIRKIVEEAITDDAMFVVDVTINPGNKIVVEVDSDNNVGIDDCVVLSKTIEAQLDRDAEDFELEVGTAGLSAPLRLPRQYKKYIDKDVEVLTKAGENLTGVLKSADEQGIELTITKMEKPEGAKRKVAVDYNFAYKYEEIKYTKYQIRFK